MRRLWTLESKVLLEGVSSQNSALNSTAKLNTGMQYSEGQEVTINAHNQLAAYPVRYTAEQKVMGFANHMGGIRWKILAIMWCKKANLISKCAGEPVFLLSSEHITEWANYETTQETHVHVTYPRWRFVPESRIKAIMTSPMVELSESQRKIKNSALQGTEPAPMDPEAPEIWAELKEARDASFHRSPKKPLLPPPQAKSSESLVIPQRGNHLSREARKTRLHQSPRRTRANSTTSSRSCVIRSSSSNQHETELQDSRERKIR